jgi:DNA-binding GntR family transcriptional regulator
MYLQHVLPNQEQLMGSPATPQIRIDRSSPIPLYHQVATQLEASIRSGELPVGAWLDNEVGLASRLGVSRPTMRQAISQLVDNGFVVRQRGVGTRVVSNSIVRPIALTSLYDDLAKAGLEVDTVVREREQVKASGEAADLFGAEAALIQISRVRGVDGKPIALMRNWIPATFTEVTAKALGRAGLYDLMRAGGAELRTAHQVIGARAATAEEAATLGIAPGAACVTMKRRTYDPMGVPLELGDHIYRGDRYQLASTLTSR